MKKLKKIRTSTWVDPRWILLLNERGMTLSSFISKALPMFLDLPDDPREKLIQEEISETVLRIRSTYGQEMTEIMKKIEPLSQKEYEKKLKDAELYDLGELLKQSSVYSKFELCLKRKSPDDLILQIITNDVNKMNGRKFTEIDLWNKSIDWYRLQRVKA